MPRAIMTPLFLLLVAFLAATGGRSFPHGDVALLLGDVSFPHGDASFRNGGGLAFANGGVTPDSPTGPGGAPGRFSIPAIPNPEYIPGPSKRGSFGNGTGTGSVEARSVHKDMIYLSQVLIGNPPQNLTVALDDRNQFNGQTLYDPRKSTASRQLAEPSMQAGYLDTSSTTCDLYQDTVTLAGLTVPNQVIGAARKVSQEFASDLARHGVLGLGPRRAVRYPGDVDPLNPPGHTLLEVVIPPLDSPVFTMDLTHWSTKRPGAYNFGFIDTEAFIGDIKYVSVDSTRGSYEFAVTGYAIGSRLHSTSSNTSSLDKNGGIQARFRALPDSGSSDFMLPWQIVKAYYDKIPGADFLPDADRWTLPCDGERLLDFSYRIGSYPWRDDEEGLWITVPGRHMALWPVRAGERRTCYGAMQTTPHGGENILGIPTLRPAFLVHNFTRDGKPTALGWAAKVLE